MGGEDDGAFAHLGSKQNTANKLRRRGGEVRGGGSTRRYNWYLVHIKGDRIWKVPTNAHMQRSPKGRALPKHTNMPT